MLLVKLQILSVAVDLAFELSICTCRFLKLMILHDCVGLGEGTVILYSKICPWLPVSKDVTADKENLIVTDSSFQRKDMDSYF